jgi:threonylcarbamoyladenosine tRNA methylthiotransferase MtaB
MLSEKKKRAFYQGFIQQERTVLWEAVNDDGRMMGYTDNYIRLSKSFDAEQVNTIETVVMENNSVKMEY